MRWLLLKYGHSHSAFTGSESTCDAASHPDRRRRGDRNGGIARDVGPRGLPGRDGAESDAGARGSKERGLFGRDFRSTDAEDERFGFPRESEGIAAGGFAHFDHGGVEPRYGD